MSRRPDQRRITRVGGATQFLPTQLSGLVLWLRADLGVTIGTGVSSWADQSGNGNNVTQGTGAKQPTFVASGGANNTPYVQGVKASATSLGGTFTWAQPAELFAVMQWGGSPASGDTAIDGHGGNNGRVYLNGTTNMNFGTDGGINVVIVSGPVITNWQRYDALWNGTSGIAYVASTQSTQLSGTGVGTGNPSGITLFSFGDGASAPANVNIAEVFGYSRVLSASERAAANAYIRTRYGV
jgi:hypothetical protein